MGSSAGAYAAGAPTYAEKMKLKPPNTYAEWLCVVDEFRAGNDAVIEVMDLGTIEWTAVVAERWTAHLAAALGARLAMVSKNLQVALDRSNGESFAVSNGLLNARRSLVHLRRFAQIRCLPNDVRDHLQTEIGRWADETQDILEKNAAKITLDGGRLLKTLRDNRLNAAVSEPTSINEACLGEASTLRRRRVIL